MDAVGAGRGSEMAAGEAPDLAQGRGGALSPAGPRRDGRVLLEKGEAAPPPGLLWGRPACPPHACSLTRCTAPTRGHTAGRRRRELAGRIELRPSGDTQSARHLSRKVTEPPLTELGREGQGARDTPPLGTPGAVTRQGQGGKGPARSHTAPHAGASAPPGGPFPLERTCHRTGGLSRRGPWSTAKSLAHASRRASGPGQRGPLCTRAAQPAAPSRPPAACTRRPGWGRRTAPDPGAAARVLPPPSLQTRGCARARHP